MTCIIGLKHKNTAYLAADSLGGNTNGSYNIREDKKIFERDAIDGTKWIFGYTTSFRMGQLLQYKLILPNVEHKVGQDLFVEMVNLMDVIRTLFKDGGFSTKDKERESGGNFLIAVNGELFEIESDFQVAKVTANYMSCGCGEDLALGALWVGTQNQSYDPILVINNSLNAVIAHNALVKPPFIIFKSESPSINKTEKENKDENNIKRS